MNSVKEMEDRFLFSFLIILLDFFLTKLVCDGRGKWPSFYVGGSQYFKVVCLRLIYIVRKRKNPISSLSGSSAGSFTLRRSECVIALRWLLRGVSFCLNF